MHQSTIVTKTIDILETDRYSRDTHPAWTPIARDWKFQYVDNVVSIPTGNIMRQSPNSI